jgi:hypothetical protein
MKTCLTTLITLFLFIPFTQSQNVGVGTVTPLAKLSVGSSSQFRVDDSGNLIRINNIPYSWPTANAANQYLKNDGSGNLTWAPIAKPVVRIFSVVPQPGFGAWLIDNASDYGSNNNADPTLVLQRGFTYQFAVNAPGHPFFITSTPGSGSYNVGVTGNGTQNGVITFTVPMDAPANLYYYCSVHAAMAGTFNIQ